MNYSSLIPSGKKPLKACAAKTFPFYRQPFKRTWDIKYLSLLVYRYVLSCLGSSWQQDFRRDSESHRKPFILGRDAFWRQLRTDVREGGCVGREWHKQAWLLTYPRPVHTNQLRRSLSSWLEEHSGVWKLGGRERESGRKGEREREREREKGERAREIGRWREREKGRGIKNHFCDDLFLCVCVCVCSCVLSVMRCQRGSSVHQSTDACVCVCVCVCVLGCMNAHVCTYSLWVMVGLLTLLQR